MPDVSLPAYRGGYPEDAAEHVRRAVESHAERFGERPRGMWPSEGSVCQAIIPLLAEHGIEWIATDEEILGLLDAWPGRARQPGPCPPPRAALPAVEGPRGRVRAGDHLPRSFDVRPGRVPLPAEPRPGRGRRLPGQGPRDRRRLPPQPGDARPGDPRRRELLGILPRRRRLVPPLALPGGRARPEDPAGQGRRVPRRASAARGDTLPRLFAGSWISHNFAIWIGHPEDNRGWDALHAAREFLVDEERSGRHDAADLARAWDEIYIAEGSDWFWWYGDDHFERPGRALRPPVPQAPAQRLHAPGLRPAGLAVHPDRAGCGPSSASRPAGQLPPGEGRRPGAHTSSGSTPRGTSAATTAGP